MRGEERRITSEGRRAADRRKGPPPWLRIAILIVTLAVAAYVVQHAEPPAWAIEQGGPLATYARRLAEVMRSEARPDDALAALFKPLQPPLKLSYSAIYEYELCPRCYYLRRILHFPEPEGTPQVIGTAAHAALAAFYKRLRSAEADGLPPPTVDDLLTLGREEFLRQLPIRAEADPEQLRQLDAQLRLTHGRLIRPGDEVEQLEHPINFGYSRDGHTHSFHAKIDRIDRLPTGGHRIVDYKTGRPKKSLLEPDKNDLQFGIYAIALRHHQNGLEGEPDPLDPPLGTAEYWLLATGERGTIDLADLDYEKLKSRIDGVIDGLLAGDFQREARGCWGLCEVVVGR